MGLYGGSSGEQEAVPARLEVGQLALDHRYRDADDIGRLEDGRAIFEQLACANHLGVIHHDVREWDGLQRATTGGRYVEVLFVINDRVPDRFAYAHV